MRKITHACTINLKCHKKLQAESVLHTISALQCKEVDLYTVVQGHSYENIFKHENFQIYSNIIMEMCIT